MTKPSGNTYVFGKNSVRTLLETDPKRVFKILLSDSLKPDKRIDAIYDLSRQHGIPTQQVPRQKLDGYIRETEQALNSEGTEIAHQGVVAMVTPKAILDLPALLSRCKQQMESDDPSVKYPLVLVLDGITDPRNFGAILRVADGAGVTAVVVPKHNSAGFTAAVSKSASGADQTIDIVMVGSLSHTIESLKKIGFWVVGTKNAPDATEHYKLDYKMPTVLIMGSEGTGIRPVIQKECDFLIKIPMAGAVSSLNVAVATGIIAFEIRKAHWK